MLVKVRDIRGFDGIPTCRKNVGAWLIARNIRSSIGPSTGGPAHFVHLSDLPDPERLAFLRKQLTEMHLDPGTYDDAAHETYAQATSAVRERANASRLWHAFWSLLPPKA